jgi:hypothetical protein
MQWNSTRARALSLAVGVAGSLFWAVTALAYDNGALPRSALTRIYHPSLSLYLDRDAAASWNTMRLYFTQQGTDIYPLGHISAYRTFAEQVQAKAEFGSNAAVPGTSNHGWGLACDLATTGMRSDLDRWGSQFGWAKRWSDASWEWWHIKYRSGVWHQRPDPGIDPRKPTMERGSGGPGQDVCVKEIQRELRRHNFSCTVDGAFGPATEQAVKDFQTAYGLKSNGVVRSETWSKLRGPVKKTAPPSTTVPGGTGPLLQITK